MNETITVNQDRDAQLEHYQEIQEMTKVVKQLEEEMLDRKLKAKRARDNYDEAAAQLIYLIERGPDRQGTLFDKSSNGWRAMPLADTLDDLSPSVLKALAEAGIATLGNLVDWTEDNQLVDLKGIGPKAAAEIEQAAESFWEANPDLDVE